MAMISTGTAPRPLVGFASIVRIVNGMFTVKTQRASLKTLDWDQLDDIGITARQAMHEAKRPAWAGPAHWRR